MSTSYPENIVKTRNMTEPLFNLMELGIGDVALNI